MKLEHKKELKGAVWDSPAISGTCSLSAEPSPRAAALGSGTVHGSLQYIKQDKLQMIFNP